MQAAHAFAPAIDDDPAGQVVQAEAPPPAKVPAAHCVQPAASDPPE
jgi:hypothetical protein